MQRYPGLEAVRSITCNDRETYSRPDHMDPLAEPSFVCRERIHLSELGFRHVGIADATPINPTARKADMDASQSTTAACTTRNLLTSCSLHRQWRIKAALPTVTVMAVQKPRKSCSLNGIKAVAMSVLLLVLLQINSDQITALILLYPHTRIPISPFSNHAPIAD